MLAELNAPCGLDLATYPVTSQRMATTDAARVADSDGIETLHKGSIDGKRMIRNGKRSYFCQHNCSHRLPQLVRSKQAGAAMSKAGETGQGLASKSKAD